MWNEVIDPDEDEAIKNKLIDDNNPYNYSIFGKQRLSEISSFSQQKNGY